VRLCRSPAEALPIDSSELNVEAPSRSEVRAVGLTTAHTVTERRDKQSPMFVELAAREQCVKVHWRRRIVKMFVAHARTLRLTNAIAKRAQRSQLIRKDIGGRIALFITERESTDTARDRSYLPFRVDLNLRNARH